MRKYLFFVVVIICLSCKNKNANNNNTITEIAIEQLEKSSLTLKENSADLRIQIKTKKPLTAQPQIDSGKYPICVHINETTNAILADLEILKKKYKQNAWDIFKEKHNNYLGTIKHLDSKSKTFQEIDKLKIIANRKIEEAKFMSNITFNNLTTLDHKLLISNIKNNILYIENALMGLYQSIILNCGIGGNAIRLNITLNAKHIRKGDVLEIQVAGTSNAIGFDFIASANNFKEESKDGYAFLKFLVTEPKGKYQKIVVVEYYDGDNAKHSMQKIIEYFVD